MEIVGIVDILDNPVQSHSLTTLGVVAVVSIESNFLQGGVMSSPPHQFDIQIC